MKVALLLLAVVGSGFALPPHILPISKDGAVLAKGLEFPDPVEILQEVIDLPQTRKFMGTAERVRSHGYPALEYKVQTSDGYILTIFRIPYSPRRNNKDVPNKPVFFLQHGLLSSSDCWILNGPDNALAFMLADAGFDVWLGNARGNSYSRKHVTKSPLFPPFWDFTWHEIGVYDLPAMIDFVLYQTGQTSLHYAGHSQGTTAFLVMLTTIPRYHSKIKTSHMLAPVYYMENMRTPFAKVCGPLLGSPSLLSDLFGSSEFMPNNQFLSMLGSAACAETSLFLPVCSNVLFLIAGWNSSHMNYTLLPDVIETHPAGASSSQFVHYLQEYESGFYRQFDHGSYSNKKVYGQSFPPNYFVENVRPTSPIQFYYSDNDYLSEPVDVLRMASELGNYVELHHVPFPDWNHLDFLWAESVKSTINDPVVNYAANYEGLSP